MVDLYFKLPNQVIGCTCQSIEAGLQGRIGKENGARKLEQTHYKLLDGAFLFE